LFRRESSLVCLDAMFDASYQRSSSEIQGSLEYFPFLQNVEESYCSMSSRSLLIVIALIQDPRLSIVGELGRPVL
jgi:hypothetical protein